MKTKQNEMKQLTLGIIIAVVALLSQGVAAKSKKATGEPIPFGKLIEMIATQSHWSEENLAKIGLTKLVSEKEEDEECGVFSYFVYGKNVTARQNEGWNVALTSVRPHAYAIEVTLTTDNGTNLYFKEKADHDAFMSKVRQSSYYNHEGECETLGGSLIESNEYKNGWYVISFHCG